MRKPYRPSNGTEGMIFDDRFCSKCRFMQADYGCPIQLNTALYDIDDPNYPGQFWVIEEGEQMGRCTAFYPEKGEG